MLALLWGLIMRLPSYRHVQILQANNYSTCLVGHDAVNSDVGIYAVDMENAISLHEVTFICCSSAGQH